MKACLPSSSPILLVLLAILPSDGAAQQSVQSDPLVRVALVVSECDEVSRAVVESQLLKSTRITIIKQDPNLTITLACHWQQSPPHSTTFYSSWGNADLAIRVESVKDESTIYAEAFSEGGKSQGIAMKKAAEAAVRALAKAGVLPNKQ